MRPARGLLLLLAACGGAGGSSRSVDSSNRALEFYGAGDFEKAEPEIRKALARDPNDLLALRLLGRIQLFRNRLKEASETLRRAVQVAPDDVAAVQDLATAYYRMDDYVPAADLYRILGEGVLHAKYSALGRLIPYVIHWDDEPAILSFVRRDPLPTVRLRVNGIKGLFILDTGSGEVVLDGKFAQKVRAKGVGVRTETFSGAMEEGYVDDIGLGGVTVRNVPVRIHRLPTGGGQEIDGLLGANLLLHFTFTVDYRRDRLILHRSAAPVSKAGAESPFLVVGERFIVVPGKIDGSLTYLFVSTGISTVPVAPSQGAVWTLAGGEPQGYKIAKVEFGPVTLANPPYDTNAFPSGLDTNYGFTIGAALGHEAFRGRVLTFEPERMKLTIE